MERNIQGRFTWFLRMFWQQSHCQLGLKETEGEQNEGRLLDSQNPIGKKQADKTTQLQHILLFILGKMSP